MSLRRVIHLRNQLPPVDPEPPPPVLIDEVPPNIAPELTAAMLRLFMDKKVKGRGWNPPLDVALNSEIVRLQRKPR